MADKQTQSQGSAIRSGYFDREAFKEKQKPILVLKTAVAGLRYHFNFDSDIDTDFIESLEPGTELKLYRDPDNEHDEWAISVYTTDDIELGYVARYKNETIARLMDHGKVFTAYVDEALPEPKDRNDARRTVVPGEDRRLPFSVYMYE
jgi:hypothetical protein